MTETIMNLIAQIKGLTMPTSISGCIALVKTLFFDIIGSMSNIYIITFAICAAVFAFAGYKLFKIGLYAGSAVVLAYVARHYSAHVIPHLEGLLPETIDTVAALMVAAAVLGILLARFARRVLVLGIGAAAGYFIGVKVVAGVIAGQFPTLEFLLSKTAVTIIAGLCAALVALVCWLIFQHVWIICSGIGGMATCGLLAGMVLMPGAGKTTLLGFIAAGVVVGIIAVIHQYNEEQKDNDVFYTYKI